MAGVEEVGVHVVAIGGGVEDESCARGQKAKRQQQIPIRLRSGQALRDDKKKATAKEATAKAALVKKTDQRWKKKTDPRGRT
jgi:hypothetical protein